jgi:hypothetical protein
MAVCRHPNLTTARLALGRSWVNWRCCTRAGAEETHAQLPRVSSDHVSGCVQDF